MNQENIHVRYNERSWAIELISQINSLADQNDLAIKRAGGESTLSNGTKCRMFPDVILYSDIMLTSILQGWELKMPDVPITDETFVKDAQRKAIALSLDSCVIWNFTYAKFYVLDKENDTFEVAKQWENLNIKERQDVAMFRADWEKTLREVVFTVNEYFLTHETTRISVSDVISQNAINLLINENKSLVADHYEKECAKNSVMEAEIDTWWDGAKIEYSFDETDKFKAYSKTVILNWAYRIIFAHLIKRQQKAAMLVNEIDLETTPSQANEIFRNITEQSDFYNVFAGLKYNEVLPVNTWNVIVDFSLFLKENGIQNIDQSILQNILEKCINTSRRELDGQFTTPKILARILANITIHDWTSDCADPCCGTGTIAHEILERKKSLCRSIPMAVSTTWASDKYATPLQIANLSMMSSETINLANLLFQSNALDYFVGKNIYIVDPRNGKKIMHTIPYFGAICSNLPFVPFENISKEDDALIRKNLPNCGLDKKSDLCYYIALHLSNILKDDGYMGIITSNAWLGTSAGENFYNALEGLFDLKQVHISGAGRWFQNADVVTTILVLQKKQTKLSQTRFYVWHQPLEMIALNTDYEKAIVNSSLLERDINPSVISCASYSTEEIKDLHNLSLSYNALFHDVKWLLEIKENLVPLRTLFKVFRGNRRGWDALFFPKEKNNIEKDFLRAALFNAKKVKTLVASSDCKAFSCSKALDELAESYKGAYSWIKKFENQKNGTGRPLPQVLKRSNEMWYEMKPNEVAQLFTMMNPDNRFFFARFEEPSFINQRLIGLSLIHEGIDDLVLCHALLNSVLMKFFIEAVGFGRGLGVLDINKDNISKCYMLSPNLLSNTDKLRIKDLFNVVAKKEIMSIERELNDADWIYFNHAVLRAYGIDEYYSSICNSLCSMRKVRRAAKEKTILPDSEKPKSD